MEDSSKKRKQKKAANQTPFKVSSKPFIKAIEVQPTKKANSDYQIGQGPEFKFCMTQALSWLNWCP